MTSLSGKQITVAGLGRFGGNIAAARWLVGQGARVLVTDQASAADMGDSVRQLDGLPVEFRLGEHREEDFTKADLVVASPAIPPNSQYLLAAKNAGVPVTTEIRLFVERCVAPVIGVTGTKGKSTTTALLGRMLSAKYRTWTGGNIGGSLLANLPEFEPTHIVVLELSSYMLEHLKAMSWSPHVALVTMVAADHIAWHGSVEAYHDAKRNIVRFQRPDDVAVLNGHDPGASAFTAGIASRVVTYPLNDSKSFDLTLPGAHNQLNAQGAFAAAHVLGVTWEQAQAAIADFPGLPHRLQLVHEADGVRYYNDSIATIPEAAIAALESFAPKRVLQIVGGYDSGAPLGPMCNALTERAKAVFCIGTIGPQIAAMLGESTSQSAAEVYDCGDLATAVKLARQKANAGDIVLLSTGCKSYDQFTNFEQRGDRFIALARGERSGFF
jgi:UDP-N-acetylmuramoylalanine--D-glutamate ligase